MTYSIKEQKANRNLLIEALRSGNYKQGMRQLRDNDQFCCLGVACDVYDDSLWSISDQTEDFRYLGEIEFLPNKVADFYGFISVEALFTFDPNISKRFDSLTYANDHESTFEEISDLIEQEPEGLFVKD